MNEGIFQRLRRYRFGLTKANKNILDGLVILVTLTIAAPVWFFVLAVWGTENGRFVVHSLPLILLVGATVTGIMLLIVLPPKDLLHLQNEEPPLQPPYPYPHGDLQLEARPMKLIGQSTVEAPKTEMHRTIDEIYKGKTPE